MPNIPMPSTDWWSDRGLAVVIVGILIFVGIVALREWWKVRKPHLVAMQAAELDTEREQAQFLRTLRETRGEEINSRVRQTVLLEKIEQRQDDHAEDCRESRLILQGRQDERDDREARKDGNHA